MADNNGYGSHGSSENSEYTSHRPGAVRRAIAKVKNTTGIAHDTKAAYVDYHDNKEHPHPKVEDLTNTVGKSLIQELMQYMKGPEGQNALEVIFQSQSRVAARCALSEDAKRAARVAAEEATTGTYDGVQRKWQESFSAIPPTVRTLGSAVLGAYVVLLSTGFLFSLWRFALFGLQ